MPNVSWTTLPDSLVTGTTATYVATFTEAVYGVAAADFSNASNAAGCVFSPSADSGTTRTVDVTCDDGGLTARFAANGAIDTAGNTGPSAARTAAATTAMRKLYDFASHEVLSHRALRMPIRTSSLRSLGAHLNVFAAESFMDELAELAGTDPLTFRLRHLSDERARAVLERAAALAG